MTHRRRIACTAMLAAVLGGLTPALAMAAPSAPFIRGVNLTNWFQAASPGQINFRRYNPRDFERIRNLGADVIRLPINLHHMTTGTPEHTLDPLFLSYLDQAIDWAETLDLHLVIDNHTFDPSTDTDPAVADTLLAVWPQLALHLRDRSERIYYEILNEPHGIPDATWNAIQQDVIDAIRAVDTRHWIIVGPANWNSYHNLDEMPVYDDDRLIYTFHFYDPFLFTHQGATWVQPSMDAISGVPFPYDAARMPPLPAAFRGSWLESAWSQYPDEGTAERVREQLDIAVAFAETRDVPLLAGEFGVLMSHSDVADRVDWYRVVREHLEAHDIAWTTWDYHHGFGLFEQGSAGDYAHDLNVPLLQALGFNTPPQTDPVTTADMTGSVLYDDAAGPGVQLSGSGGLDFHRRPSPAQGGRSIEWRGAARYAAIAFDFIPDRDLGFLATNDYALSFSLRCDTPGTRLDVRFLDTDHGPDDHPWRMGVLLEENDLVCDDQWQSLHLPLADLAEQGAWEAGEWFDPRGDFDWSAVDRLEFANDTTGTPGMVIGLDDIQLTRQLPGTRTLANAAGLNGLFYDPSNPGHGFDINFTDDGLVVYYYGHTEGGERLWLVSEAGDDHLRFGQPIELALYEWPGGAFGTPAPGGTTPWGMMTLILQDCHGGDAVLDGLDGRVVVPLVRLAGVPGVFCDSAAAR